MEGKDPTDVKETSEPVKVNAQAPLIDRVVGDSSAAADLQTTEADVPEVNTGDEERAVDASINDLGWSEDPHVPIPILYGIKNEDVWQLVRRFNNQIFYLKTIDTLPQGGIDLNIADKDEFTPEKLRSTLERVYITIGLGVAAFVKHVARLRSWHERKRTSIFFVSFLIVWFFDLVVPAFFSLITVLLASPRARTILFPPAPLAAISAKTGKAKVPKAGQLGSESLTGAAESYKGEAAEQEASNAVGSVAHLAVSTAIGNNSTKVQNHQDVESSDEDSDNDEVTMKSTTMVKPEASVEASKAKDVPDPSSVALASRDAQSKAKGDKHTAPNQHDASAAPVEHSIWTTAQPFLHGLEDAADTWERFGNALRPTPPFPQRVPRLRIAGLIAPVALLSFFVSSRIVYRASTLAIGLAFFAQPVFDMLKVSDVKKWLDTNIPDWPRYLELRNSILKGVPTNAQLTITLLRIGEAKKSPLPPPPPAVHAPPPTAKEGEAMTEEIPDEYKEQFDAHREKVETEASQGEEEEEAAKTEKKKKGSAFVAFIKGTVRAGANTALGTNRVKAEAGFQRAKQKVGVVHTEPNYQAAGDGPAGFHGRFKGKRGLALVSTSSTTPCLSFERAWPAHARAAHAAYMKARESSQQEGAEESETVKTLREVAEKARPTPLFSIQLDDIVSLKKLGGLGWKGKLIVGWSMEGQVDDGIDVETKDGKHFILTALPRRDELFNRLASLGKDHCWESW